MRVFLKNLDLSAIKHKHRRAGMNPAATRPLAPTFPVKLHRMLADVEREGKGHIVSWNPDGRTFQVHNHGRFVSEVLPHHFKQTKYKSFQRQLNLYLFHRLTSGPLEGAYGHPSFVRGDEDACRNVRRQAKPPQLQLQQQQRHSRSVATLVSSTAADSEGSFDFQGDIESAAADKSGGLNNIFDADKWNGLWLNQPQNSNYDVTCNDRLGAEIAKITNNHLHATARRCSEGTRISFLGKSFFILPADFADMHNV